MRLALSAALLALLADQMAKWWVLTRYDLAHVGRVEVWPPWVAFHIGWNRGINFGLFGTGGAAQRWFLVLLALAVGVGVLVWAARSLPRAFDRVFAGFLAGGAFANALDRLQYGAVLDFLNVSCCGFHNPYAFNPADVFIFLGAAGLALLAVTGDKKKGAA